MRILDDYFALLCLLFIFSAISGLVYLYLCLMKRKSDFIKSLTVFRRAEDLLAALHASDNGIIPCAFVTGVVTEKDLIIFDYMYEAVIRHSKIEEVYDVVAIKGLKRNYRESRVVINENTDTVDFGLMEQGGEHWLVHDLGTNRMFMGLLTAARTSFQYPTVLQAGFSDANTTRTLKRVETKVTLLQKGVSVTLMGRFSFTDDMEVRFSRSNRNPYPVPGIIVSRKTPQGMANKYRDAHFGCHLLFYLCVGICALISLRVMYMMLSAFSMYVRDKIPALGL